MEPEEVEEQGGIQMLLFRITHRYFTKMFQQLSSTGVHPGQIPMIRLLGKRGGVSQKEIARMLKIKPPTVTVSLRRMENAGLIERKPDEKDQRVSRIYLSKTGMDVYEKMKVMVEYNEKFLLKGYTQSELCLLERFLRQMMENVEGIPVDEIFENKSIQHDQKEVRI